MLTNYKEFEDFLALKQMCSNNKKCKKLRKTSKGGSKIKNALDPRLPDGKTRLYVCCPSVCPSTETPNSAKKIKNQPLKCVR